MKANVQNRINKWLNTTEWYLDPNPLFDLLERRTQACYADVRLPLVTFIKSTIDFYGRERVDVKIDVGENSKGLLEIINLSIDIHYPNYTLNVNNTLYPMKDMFVRFNFNVAEFESEDSEENTDKIKYYMMLSDGLQGLRTTVTVQERIRQFSHPHLVTGYGAWKNFCKGSGDIGLLLVKHKFLTELDNNVVIELLLHVESLLGFENTEAAYGGSRFKDVISVSKLLPPTANDFLFTITSLKHTFQTFPNIVLNFDHDGNSYRLIKDDRYVSFTEQLILYGVKSCVKINNEVNEFTNAIGSYTEQPVVLNYSFKGKPIEFQVEGELMNKEITKFLNPIIENHVIEYIEQTINREISYNKFKKGDLPKPTTENS